MCGYQPKEAAACLDAMDAHAAADALASMDTKAVAACVEKLETEKAVALLDVMGQSEASRARWRLVRPVSPI